MVTWVIGLAIAGWTGLMGLGALLGTKSAKAWFGEILGQSPTLMKINGAGLLIMAAAILLNLLVPAQVSLTAVKWAIAGLIITQAITLFTQFRGGAPVAARTGPIVLTALAVIYWFLAA